VWSRETGARSRSLDFEAVSAAKRKRKAGDSVNDKLAAMVETITQLMTVQKQMAESQKVLLESNMTMMETIKTLKAIVQESAKQRSYSEAVTDDSTTSSTPSHTSEVYVCRQLTESE
jgi:DNA polymerase III alpha subunit (gram-positive type)